MTPAAKNTGAPTTAALAVGISSDVDIVGAGVGSVADTVTTIGLVMMTIFAGISGYGDGKEAGSVIRARTAAGAAVAE
jgi:hypothetical protein